MEKEREDLETEEPASFLSKRIHHHGSQEQTHGERYSDLDHTVSDIQDNGRMLFLGHVHRGIHEALGAVRDDGIRVVVFGQLFRGCNSRHQGAARGQAGGDKDKDGGKHRGGRDPVS